MIIPCFHPAISSFCIQINLMFNIDHLERHALFPYHTLAIFKSTAVYRDSPQPSDFNPCIAASVVEIDFSGSSFDG